MIEMDESFRHCHAPILSIPFEDMPEQVCFEDRLLYKNKVATFYLHCMYRPQVHFLNLIYKYHLTC